MFPAAKPSERLHLHATGEQQRRNMLVVFPTLQPNIFRVYTNFAPP